jgi:hypothetical protein
LITGGKPEDSTAMSIQLQNSAPSLQSCFDRIIDRIDNEKKPLDNRELLAICRDSADFLQGETDAHFCHETAETALNLLINQKYAKSLLAADKPAEAVRDFLKPLARRLSTQSWRSREQTERQQFSTPPGIAYLAAYLLNFQAGERVLEPSAGTGSLAVWSSGSGLSTHVNEIDPRRRSLLAHLGFASTAFDAEFIHDFLPPEITADCLLMNPPFSANGERTQNHSCKFGFRHVASALERLNKGGKFAVILGAFAELSAKTGDEFWKKMSGKVSVKAIIKIAGREYYKNGTSVETVLVIGEKLLQERKADWNAVRNRIVNFSAQTVEEAFIAAGNLNLRLQS